MARFMLFVRARIFSISRSRSAPALMPSFRTTLLPHYRQTLPERFAAFILFSGSFHGRMRVTAGFWGWHGICYIVGAGTANLLPL